MFRLLVVAGVRPSGAGNHMINRRSFFQKTGQTPSSATAAPAAWFNKPLNLTALARRRLTA
jgi:hypothetical protein